MKKLTRIVSFYFASFVLAITMSTVLFGCKQTSNALLDSGDYSADTNGVLVKTIEEYESAASNLGPGDTIVMANGVWRDAEILLKGEGTEGKPIRLMAQTEGKVILSGQSSLSLQGRYLEVSGLVFKDGYSPTGVVIAFRGESSKYAYHSRVTRTVIDGFSNPDKFNSDSWVALFGKHNRFDHNHLVGKSNAGVTMAVRLNSLESQENYHRIDYNYFGPRPILGSNGGETLRIGTSKYSLSNSFTTVENNYFDRANGEVEIISNKSGSNSFKNNVFFESRGTLTLRHGNNNLVEGNVFLGNGKSHTGGIRVINAQQTIRNNYMEGLTGIRFGGGFVILNGVPNSSINRYHQVDGAIIENNTIVGVSNINLAAGSDAERSAVPINSTFKRNLVVNESSHPFKIFDDVSGIVFAENISTLAVPDTIAYGFDVQDVQLTRNANGLLTSDIALSKQIGASLLALPVNKDDVGVSWYPKPGPVAEFNSGDVVKVATSQALMDALSEASSGDRIELESGNYSLNKQLQISTMVTIAGAENSDVTLFPMRSLTFEIVDGGSLSLENLDINGEKSPDSAGNVLIRNSRTPTLLNYRLAIIGVNISNLDVNHSAHVFDSGYRSLADDILIKDSTFTNITGDILRLNKEQDDLGIYNAEYVTFQNSSFDNVQGAIAKIYRGGTDESTFGPHFLFTNNTLSNIGLGKRNKSGASIYLHGVQDTDMIDNTFNSSADIIIEHTVGEPQTLIQNNRFNDVKLPLVTEVFTKGESTAVLIDNIEESL
ncbi:polysaccharide lyase 6 family protein [Glaciecola sp. SC05]|uniref:polysaccharide lyase 6 family protein n=1 Tax=Glaciecola sp. SC05 TaxID=1987355 RepID=UPI0035283B21